MTSTDAIDALPRTARPREWLLDAHHQLLGVRQLVATSAGRMNGTGWASGGRIRAAVEAVDRLREELLSLAVEAEARRVVVDADKAVVVAAREAAKPAVAAARAVAAAVAAAKAAREGWTPS